MKNLDGLYCLEPIAEIIETCIFSAFIEHEIPISTILVGPSGVAKSKLIKRYGDEFIHHTDSVTSQGIFEIVQRDPKNEKKFIFIPDLNPTLSRKHSTSSSAVANLLSITSDGTVRTDDGRAEKIMKHDPVGLITACTPEVYNKNARHWFALGLRRRIIPIFYSYSVTTENYLQQLVRENKIHSIMLPPVKMKVPQKSQRLPIKNDIALPIEKLSDAFATNLGKLSFVDDKIKKWETRDVVPVSPHVTIRTLVMAHALQQGRKKITKEDLLFAGNFVEFTDPATPRKI